MDKAKSKLKSTLPRDFVSPFALETCVYRLERKGEKERDIWLRPAFRVRLSNLDPDTYRFRISKRASRGYSATIAGYLKRQDSRSTLVMVRPVGELLLLVFTGLMLVLGVFLSLTSGHPDKMLPLYLIFMPVAGIVGWVYLKLETAALLRSLQD